MRLLANALVYLALPLSVVAAPWPPATRVGSHRPSQRMVVADTVTGEWKATGRDPGWNGKFTLRLIIEQTGDSLRGTYQFEVENATVVPAADIAGRIHGNKIQLQDRADRFWLDATIEGKRLRGRLAGSSRGRASALPISFERVK